MNLHEYQAKRLLREYAVPVPSGFIVRSPDEVENACVALGGTRWMVKAQVHAGGRGKAGGVVMADSQRELREQVARLLGTRLVTQQTDAVGLPVDALLIERPSEFDQELYLSLLVDRGAERILVMASASGGMDIEEVAAATPERICSLHIHPAAGLQPYHARQLGYALALEAGTIRSLAELLDGLYRLFRDCDASLIEINPLVLAADGTLMALDAKIRLDDNALSSHPRLARMRDCAQENAREVEARRFNLNYIHLGGDIGCMVNGAGLAMATMDLVKLRGGAPANFLDVGGGTTAERVAEAFRLILADPAVNAVLVNIFGGIVRCDLIAEGIVQAIRGVGVDLPVVVRLQGTNARRGLELLADAGLALQTASSLEEAAEKAVAAAAGRRAAKNAAACGQEPS